ncbi:MarR family transcriptional regulator [Thermococcus sp.]|uniref:helix-turn-helix transcriptional regulator n=1 Tax=Thermococcus sp. TaxID=35749 RepID=UPI002621ADDE|nr:MarR family transcriptional regulator [Thermococcus sp.]
MKVQVLKKKYGDGKIVMILRVEVDVNNLPNYELGDVETRILDLLLDNEEITQRQLSQLFGRTKACRAIKNLENMGLIRREKKGRTYVVRVV